MRRYFPAGLRYEEVQVQIIRIQEDLLYQKVGMSGNRVDCRRKVQKTTIQALFEWFVAIMLIERLLAKHEYRDYKLDSAEMTLTGYEKAVDKLKAFLQEFEGTDNYPVERLTRDRINRFKRWLIKSGISPYPINSMLRKLRVIFKKARYENQVHCDALTDFEFVKEHQDDADKRSTLTLAEMKAVAEIDYVTANLLVTV